MKTYKGSVISLHRKACRVLSLLVEALDSDVLTDAPEMRAAVERVLKVKATARRILGEIERIERGRV